MILKTRKTDFYETMENINPITNLTINDPHYSKDVWCRYEKEGIYFDHVEIELIKDHLISDNFEYDSYILCLRLADKSYDNHIEKEESYKIGVDTARYYFETNHNKVEIYTAADGMFGGIREMYFDGKPKIIDINLLVPDDVMSPQMFIESVALALGIDVPKLVNTEEQELNQDLDKPEEVQVMG